MRKVKFEDIFPKSLIEKMKNGACQEEDWECCARMMREYLKKNVRKGDVVRRDYENQQIIIYEYDKDKEIIEKMKEKEREIRLRLMRGAKLHLIKPIVRIGGRKGEFRHNQAYYSQRYNEIVLMWPWYQKEKSLEKEIADTLEHEYVHWVLEKLIGNEASLWYDEIQLECEGMKIIAMHTDGSTTIVPLWKYPVIEI